MEKLSRKGVVQMISIPSFVQRSRHSLRHWITRLQLQRFIRPGLHTLAGFFLSAASAAARPLPLAMGLICGSGGWPAVAGAVGAAAGYLLFWPRSGEICLWILSALAISTLQRRSVWERAPYLVPALSAMSVAVAGVVPK